MLLVTIIPLAAHLYSIDKYSNYIEASEIENKRESIGKVLASTVQGKHRSNVLLAANLVAENQELIQTIDDSDAGAINEYLSRVKTAPVIEKIDIDIIGLQILNSAGRITAAWGTVDPNDDVVQNFVAKYKSSGAISSTEYDDTFEAGVDGVPYYLMTVPIKGTTEINYLVVVASVWNSLIGITNSIGADFEVLGTNGEILFSEKYDNGQLEMFAQDSENFLRIESDKIPVGNNGNFVTTVAYVDGSAHETQMKNMQYTAIVVAIVFMLIVWMIGTYLLKVSFFRRIALFSKTMKDIVDGNPIENPPSSRDDEFDVLAKQLQRVIEHDAESTRIKKELEKAIEQSEVANVAKSDFLANMSHELRTPLNAIIGFSEILANESMEEYSKTRTQEYATDIMQSGRHLLSIINDILDLSKVEAGKMRFYEDEVDIIEICETSMRVLQNQADDKNIDIALKANNDFPLIKADERMMQQILTNLLSNAVKFSLDGGDIEIAVELTSKNIIQVSVTDNGIGIAQNKLQDIMEPFHQVETSYAKTEVGTGLGLSLVKAFVEIHDGRVQIESELGKRTTVYVFLPGSRVVCPEEDAFCSLDYKNVNRV